jgi:polysaccharide export outer membrane protein
MRTGFAVLNFFSNFQPNNRGFPMKSGTLGSARYCCFTTFAVAAFFISAAAQQATSPQDQASPPATLPAGQPVSEAAQSASDAAVTTQTPNDSKKSDVDQTALTKLGAGDLLEVTVYNVPELTSKVRVSNSGDVYLPLIDYVHVEGLTQEEAQSVIQKRLEDGGFVRSPHVTIFVDEASSQGVTLIGEVAKPGIYPDVVDHRLYEVISEAGGFTQNASRKIAILRKGEKTPIRIDLPRNLADDLNANVEIMPGDTISIPRAPIIYVVGDVGRPSGLLVDNGELTVLQALALAGGTNHTAKLSGARIIRKGPNGMFETRVQIKKMLEAKTPDMPLQADDILFVPVSSGRVMAGKTLEVAMAAATAATVYTVHP